MKLRLFKPIIFVSILGSFAFAQAMKHDSFDKKFQEFTEKALYKILSQQISNEIRLSIMDDCLQKILYPRAKDKKESAETIIDYSEVPLHIIAHIQYKSQPELNREISQNLTPFIFIGYLLQKEYSGSIFIPRLIDAMKYNHKSLISLPKPIRNQLVELMIIDTKILIDIPFELLCTTSGAKKLQKTKFGEKFALFCALQTSLAKSQCSLDKISFNNAPLTSYPKPFLELYNQISDALTQSHKKNTSVLQFDSQECLSLTLKTEELDKLEKTIMDEIEKNKQPKFVNTKKCLHNFKIYLETVHELAES